MKLQQLKQGQFFCCLPRAIVRAKGWQKRDNIKIEINKDGDIVLKKIDKKDTTT